MHSAQRPRTTQAWRTAFTTPSQFGRPAVTPAPPKPAAPRRTLASYHRKAETAFLLALALLLVVLAILKH